MFKFKLQPLLDYRKQIEEKKLTEVAGIKRLLMNAKSYLSELELKQKELSGRLKSFKEKGSDSAEVSICCIYVTHIQQKKKHQRKEIDIIEQAFFDKQKELNEAVKKRKVIEIIRDKQMQTYQTSLMVQKQKEMDELGVLKYGRKETIEATDNRI